MTLPLPSFSVTTLPGSAVPVIGSVPPVTGVTVGAVGATVSTTSVTGALTAPVTGSVAVALTTVPAANGVDGVTLYAPLLSAISEPMTLPLLSFKVTMLPASASPVIGVTPPATASMVGSLGAGASTTVVVDGPTLPPASTAVALTTVPSASGVDGVTL